MILVLGVPRSGTSVTSGVLHHLGVFMGERFLPTTRMNPKGFWHDLDFELSWSLGGTQELIAKRMAMGKPWGVNTRRSQEVVHAFKPIKPKVIVTSRPMPAVKSSCEKWFKDSSFVGKFHGELKKAVNEMNAPTLKVDFDSLVDDPSKIVQAIADFVGLPVTQSAIDFVDPTLRNFR